MSGTNPRDQRVAVGKGAQLPLEEGPVEHVLGQGELELEPERLQQPLAEDHDLVEPALVDPDGDVTVPRLGADRREVIARPAQEGAQLRRDGGRLRARGADVLREIEDGAVDELVEEDVALKDDAGLSGIGGGCLRGRQGEEQQRGGM
jgi:hypothetical protein